MNGKQSRASAVAGGAGLGRRRRALIGFVLVAIVSGSVAAQDLRREDAWEFGMETYGWVASPGGHSAAGDQTDIDIWDIVDALDFGFMGVLEARRGRWSLMADVIYLNLRQNSSEIDVDLEGWTVTPAVRYNVLESATTTLDILGGARYLWLDAALQPAGSPKISDSGDVWDGIVGVTAGACKQGMDISYKGTWGYHVLIVSAAETGFNYLLMDIEFPAGQSRIGYAVGESRACKGEGLRSEYH